MKKLLIFSISLLLLMSFDGAHPLKKRVQIGSATFHINIADTKAKGIKGLSGVAKIEKDEGLLFVYRRSYRPHIWMKGMYFPLDLVWIKNGHVQEITENVPVLKREESISRRSILHSIL